MAVVNGTAGNDILNGTLFGDQINAFAGDDLVFGSTGADTIDGGGDSDTVDYSVFLNLPPILVGRWMWTSSARSSSADLPRATP